MTQQQLDPLPEEINRQIHTIELLAQASPGDEIRDTLTGRKALVYALMALGCLRISYLDDDSLAVLNPMDFSQWELVPWELEP